MRPEFTALDRRGVVPVIATGAGPPASRKNSMNSSKAMGAHWRMGCTTARSAGSSIYAARPKTSIINVNSRNWGVLSLSHLIGR